MKITGKVVERMENRTEISIKIYYNEVEVQKVKTQCKSFEVKKGHFIKSHHKWKQVIAIVTPFICIFEKTFVVNFDPFSSFLFIDLANFNCPFSSAFHS